MHKRWPGLLAAALVFLALWLAPTHEAPLARRALAVAGLMIVLWATEALDHAWAGGLGLALFFLLGIAPARRVLSGFWTETCAFLLGAMLIGAMVGKSGLALRVAHAVMRRAGSTYSRVLLAFVVADFLLTFLVPSGIARVTILAAIATGAVESLGGGPKTNIGRGLLIVITYAAGIFDKMVIAGAVSILARGIIQDVAKVPVLYSQWFLAYLPCDLITILCCWRVILWLYPPEAQPATDKAASFALAPKPWTLAEKKAAFYVGSAVVLWMTDFLHHLSPAWIGSGVALLAVTPRIGVLGFKDIVGVRWGAIVFTAAALSMSRVLADTKALDLLTRVLVGWMEPLVSGPLSSALVLYWTAFGYHFFLANETAMLGTSLPVVLGFAAQKGLDPLATGMIWTFAAGGKIFVYQSAVTLVGYSYGYFEAKDLLKVGAVLTLVESLILLLLVPLYWPLIGLG